MLDIEMQSGEFAEKFKSFIGGQRNQDHLGLKSASTTNRHHQSQMCSGQYVSLRERIRNSNPTIAVIPSKKRRRTTERVKSNERNNTSKDSFMHRESFGPTSTNSTSRVEKKSFINISDQM